MNHPEVALRHQVVSHQATQLEAFTRRLESQLATDPKIESLGEELNEVSRRHRQLERQIRDREAQVEVQRQRMRGRERELMSGRIASPSELMKLDQEVSHLRSAVAEAEDGELTLMEESESLDRRVGELTARLEQARVASSSARPGIEAELAEARVRLVELKAEREQLWGRLPDDWQAAYIRLSSRHSDPVAEVARDQCQRCHVAVTSNGMQQLRRAALVLCDNCGRLLVLA
jgi:predicted  nucleic acid-binding Zn-ribbon protein